MSKVDLRIDDLDADQLGVIVGKLQEFNMRVANITAERDKYASIAERHLIRLASEKGIDPTAHDFDLGTKSFVPKLQPVTPVEALPKTE